MASEKRAATYLETVYEDEQQCLLHAGPEPALRTPACCSRVGEGSRARKIVGAEGSRHVAAHAGQAHDQGSKSGTEDRNCLVISISFFSLLRCVHVLSCSAGLVLRCCSSDDCICSSFAYPNFPNENPNNAAENDGIEQETQYYSAPSSRFEYIQDPGNSVISSA